MRTVRPTSPYRAATAVAASCIKVVFYLFCFASLKKRCLNFIDLLPIIQFGRWELLGPSGRPEVLWCIPHALPPLHYNTKLCGDIKMASSSVSSRRLYLKWCTIWSGDGGLLQSVAGESDSDRRLRITTDGYRWTLGFSRVILNS